MTEPQDQGQTTPQESTTPGQGQQQEQPYFVAKTKDEYERTFGPTRQEGRDALLKKLGFEKPTELESFVNEYREVQDAAKSETEREREARLAAEQERDKYRAIADSRLVDSEIRIALLRAGIPADRVTAASKLIEGDFDVENGNVLGVDEAVASALESMPWLMGEAPQRQTYRAADTSQVPVNTGDPNAAMGSFLNQVLNGP